jgi:intracellular septation protein
MKILLDFLPILLFFGTYRYADHHQDWASAFATEHLGHLVAGGQIGPLTAPVLLATVVVILATLLQVGIQLARRQKIDTLLWVNLGIVVVLGGLTVWLNNETFIKWKPTVYYWVAAVAMLATQYVFRRNPLQALMGSQIELPDLVWRRLTWAYIGFFAAMGVLNLYVAFNYPTSTWVNFKVFALTGLMFVFMIVQIYFISPHLKEPKEEDARPTGR